ncbi:MAG: glycosyltransferase [Desulfovibrio sp.]|nr:glycosyltransferase [Desulfovibrio sp.]
MHDTHAPMPPSGTRTALAGLLRPLPLCLLAAAAFLIFYNLGQRPLWQDEAETARLAQTVLTDGIPRAFDGKNLISQEEAREYNPDDGHVWRWSPWLQIYMAAAGLALGGENAAADRFFFALAGLAAVAMTFLLILRFFRNPAWAGLSAALLTATVPFLLFCRQGRYYSVGTLLTLTTLYAFFCDWQKKTGPLVVAALSLGLLFHANYLLFLSFVPSALACAVLLYHELLDIRRLILLTALTLAMVVPGLFLYRMGSQSGMFDILLVPENLMLYFADLIMFMIPLPVLAVLAWRWRRFFTLLERPKDPAERFVLFCALVTVLSLILLALVPQRFHRYIVHFYPLCAILLAWAGLRLWRWSKPSGALFLVLVGLTNWLNLYPLERTKLINRPWENDFRMLTSLNFPLKLYLTELFSGYPDVNAHIIDFFKKNAAPGQTVLAEYGDLPLQFYTGLRVLGGLQGPPAPDEKPDWVLMRRAVRVNRDRLLFPARAFVHGLDLERDYERIELPWPDETFGNRADPYYHYFITLEPPQVPLTVYRKKAGA